MMPESKLQTNPQKLPKFGLSLEASLGAQFVSLGMRDYHAAARHVQLLPYGRNSDRSDYVLVLVERRGTCSTKHALLAALAREHENPVELRLGIYEMDEDNTPGVGSILSWHGLHAVPEAHCYLAYQGDRFDLTREGTTEITLKFLHEEKIGPAGIGAYKVSAHRSFVREWALQRRMNPAQVWRIREDCILALSEGGDPSKQKGSTK